MDSNSRSWHTCEELLLAFEAAWREAGSSSPDIAAFAQRATAEDAAYVALELIAIDLEWQWKRECPRHGEDYLHLCPPDAEPTAFRRETLAREAEVRSSLNVSPTEEELRERFGPDTEAVRELFVTLNASERQPTRAVLTAGTTFSHYTIEREIGAGAFSTVYAASDTRLNRPVAIKVLKASGASDDIRQRMMREAQAVATINHPGVVPVFEIGRAEGLDFIVSRLIDGPNLQTATSEREFDAQDAARLVAKLAEALDTAHSLGIVHRDIKPANILLEDDEPLLVDFGLAHLSEASASLTGEGDIIGTPAYMSPEQAGGRGWQADPRSDIYSLGAVLYQLICGRRTFSGSTAQVLGRVIHSEPEHPSHINPRLDKDLVTICLHCLEKAPEDRYQSARLLREDLLRYVNGETIRARRAGMSTRVWKWARRKPTLATMCTVLLLLLTFLGGTLIQLNRARRAESRTRGLLAVSATKAGELAMQRGRMEEAIDHFQEAIRLGRSDDVSIHLAQVESLVALRRLSEATELLLTTDALDGAASKETRGSQLMWRAELALEGYDPGSPVELFEQARREPLPAEDAWYVDGMLAGESPEALKCFREALQQDPFHHRARRMSIVLLLSLARLDEAAREVHTALEVFPDDIDFLLMETAVLALQGQAEEAEEKLAHVPLDQGVTDRWKQFLRAAAGAAQSATPIPVYSANPLYNKAQVAHLETLRSRGWRLPPRIAEAFEGIAELFASANRGKNQSVRKQLGRIVDIHPEGSLTVLLAEQYTTGAPESTDDAERARDLFLAAMNRPMVIKASRDYANRGLFSTAIHLALVAGRDTEQNQKLYLDAAARMDPTTEQNPKTARILTIGALKGNDIGLAETWASTWVALTPRDPDAVWHRAIVHRRRQEYLAVVSWMDKYLELKPSDEAALKIREEARTAAERSLAPQR